MGPVIFWTAWAFLLLLLGLLSSSKSHFLALSHAFFSFVGGFVGGRHGQSLKEERKKIKNVLRQIDLMPSVRKLAL